MAPNLGDVFIDGGAGTDTYFHCNRFSREGMLAS
jgi:hypothetical protein